ncbi:MAG: transglycosylase SLT domain-containing protein [Gammaproteobacteria bacterium]|jgi:membrane-bound lytic murein transglycosylase D
MALAHISWLTAVAMAAGTMIMPLHLSQDTGGIGAAVTRLWGTGTAPVSLLPGYRRADSARENSAIAAGRSAGTRSARSSTTPVAATDVWSRLREGFALQGQPRPAVQAYIDRFRKHPQHIERVLRRGEPYLFHILGRLEARGLPAELALLPVVESAFDPFASSPAGAAGIWQFMPATASHLGLPRDWWFDGRRDIVAATEAALDYLDELHGRFDGDWLLALGAYNAGRTRVNAAIRNNRSRGKPTDFWHLRLPEETRSYVPKLMALRAVIVDPSAYGIRLPDIANAPYFTSVDTQGQLDLKVAARLSGASVEELRRLNPGLVRSVTPPGVSHALLIPKSGERRFGEQLARLSADQRVMAVKYRVRRGDTLSTIARSCRTTVERLREINQLTDTRIVAGWHLIVPVAENDTNAGDAARTS